MRLFLLAAAIVSATTAPSDERPRYIAVELIASTTAPRPGSTTTLGFRMTPQAGWHEYWSNPGESGIAPTVRWTAPAEVRFGPLLHPAPTLLQSMGIVSFVHSGPHVLVSGMTISSSVRPGTPIPVRAELSWATCSTDQCIPQHASFSLPLVAGAGAPTPQAPVLARAVAALPRPAPRGSFSADGGKLVLELPKSLHIGSEGMQFFPDRNGYFDATGAHATDGAAVRIESKLKGRPPDVITGVVSNGSAAFRLSFDRGSTAHAPAQFTPSGSLAKGNDGVILKSRGGPVEAVPEPTPQQRTSSPLQWLIRALVLLGLSAFATLAFVLARRPYR